MTMLFTFKKGLFMKIASQYVFPALAIALFCGVSRADHNHITVDTIAASPQNQIVVRAGFLPIEAAFTIGEGRLYFDGEIAVYVVVDQLGQGGELNGWFAGDEILLTSDFFFATGRLDGGNFQWELASIVNVDGGEPATMAWGDYDNAGSFQPLALSTGATRRDRSFDTRIAGHDHAQGYAFSAPGLYDLTLVAWDSNSVYAAAVPLTIRFRVGVPACDADVNRDGAVDQGDVDYLLNVVAGGENPTGIDPDFDHDGAVGQGDVDAILDVVAGGACP